MTEREFELLQARNRADDYRDKTLPKKRQPDSTIENYLKSQGIKGIKTLEAKQ
jgi:hypothetical protein